MSYQSSHSGVAIDSAVEQLSQITVVRQEVQSSLTEVREKTTLATNSSAAAAISAGEAGTEALLAQGHANAARLHSESAEIAEQGAAQSAATASIKADEVVQSAEAATVSAAAAEAAQDAALLSEQAAAADALIAANSVDSVEAFALAAEASAVVATDKAVAASTSAGIAATKAAEAGASAIIADTKAIDAANSAATAAAVVSGGTASLTPEPGKIPLANSKGKLSPDWFVVDQLRASVEAASGGRTTVIYTNEGNPSYMHILPAFNCEDVAPGGELGTGTHPAFMFDGVRASEIMVGAHLGGMVGTQVVSRPGLDPRASINFDAARALCKANGPGWDIMSNLDWAAIALWCMANGYQPRGNTNYGRHHVNKWEVGRLQNGKAPGDSEGGPVARTITGSGPATWSHDGTAGGIHDLVGNVNEWVSGMKLVDGRVWLAEDNGLNDEELYIDTEFDLTAGAFSSRPNEGASNLVKQSLITPASASLAPVGTVYLSADGERLPYRGGGWSIASYAGLGYLHLGSTRTNAATTVGFRPRFRAL